MFVESGVISLQARYMFLLQPEYYKDNIAECMVIATCHASFVILTF